LVADSSNGTFDRFVGALSRGLAQPGRKMPAFDGRRASIAEKRYDGLGLKVVRFDSPDEELENFVQRLEDSQEYILTEREKEWQLHIYYSSGQQYLSFHRDRRQWIPRRTLPWRVRSTYNICGKAENIRVSRLTENKPSITVQARTADRSDVEKAEYKETLFWYLWDRLQIHQKIVRARRWAFKCGSGFLKVGFDANAGECCPVTRKVPRKAMVPQQVPGPNGQPVTELVEQVVGLDEFYLDKDGNELGPVEIDVPDEVTGKAVRQRQEPPDGTDFYYEGEAFAEVVSAFEVLWDRYVDDINESWYVQHRRILPLSKILAMFPDAADKIKDARLADEDGKSIQWSGLMPRAMVLEQGGPSYERLVGSSGDQYGYVDREYKVVETWIFPKDDNLRRLWGKSGAILTTVGGRLVDKKPLPEWALKACPFIQFHEITEEGNHYDKPPMRDLVPLQDDINRVRSTAMEAFALRSRLLLWAPQNHGMNFRILSAMAGALVTTRSRESKPEPLNLGDGAEGWQQLYESSLAAATDLGNMNDASTGKVPSAGIAAKAIYALQYADERSITEASNLQDLSLKRLAEALDAITRVEYTDRRKIRLVGADRSFLIEHEIGPDEIAVDVDYTFAPGSMMSRQKDAVKNEMLQLLQLGLVDAATVRKNLATATPDVFRLSYDLQEAHARRVLSQILKATQPEPYQPQPWEDPAVHASVLEEYMLSAKWDEFAETPQKEVIMQLWQVYKQMQQPQQPAPPPSAGGAPPSGAPAAPQASPANIPTPSGMAPIQGAEQLEAAATRTMAPPPGFGEAPPATASV
jgi:hypothetical protein